MQGYLLQTILSIVIGVGCIILFTIKFRIPAFFALFMASIVSGLSAGLDPLTILGSIRNGFGNILKSLGPIIVLGTTLGLLLEQTGKTKIIALFILQITGERFAAIALSFTGFIVGLPVFCDSGFIVLNGLIRPLSIRSSVPVTILTVSMATGLYSVHCLVPPHPGISAAALSLGVDLGKLIFFGIITAIPAMLVGYAWAAYAGRRFEPEENQEAEKEGFIKIGRSSFLLASFPIIIPILLITFNSFIPLILHLPAALHKVFQLAGDPVIALSTGIAFTFTGKRLENEKIIEILNDAIQKAGGILVIIGAGGAFGAVLMATDPGPLISKTLPVASAGLLFPFLLSFILKTAQGSSTVAIITAGSIIQPLFPAMGFSSEKGRLLCILSMAAGSMLISHANDAYFWVISRFSGIKMKPMVRVYSMATIFMGISSFLIVWLLSFFI